VKRRAAALVAVVLVSAAAGCSAAGSASDTGSALEGEVTVLAAASLTESFDKLIEQFEHQHPKVTVRASYGASSTLAQQIDQGAPADVFASASEATMDTAVKAGRIDGTPTPFARNTLQIAVPKNNPGKVTGLKDFANDKLRIALCAPQVPCGAAAKKALAAAKVTAKPDTLEADVKATLTKVALGEVDAALVYRTDVQAAAASGGNAVKGIDFPEAAKAVNVYPIALCGDAPNREAAEEFVAYVLGSDGKVALAAAGFQPPP
jgi:molybdate transport system substrate-binding protein